MRTVVEMNRLLTGLIQVIQETDTNTGVALCNEHTCPTMSAGRCVTQALQFCFPSADTPQTDLHLAREWPACEDPRSLIHRTSAKMDSRQNP